MNDHVAYNRIFSRDGDFMGIRKHDFSCYRVTAVIIGGNCDGITGLEATRIECIWGSRPIRRCSFGDRKRFLRFIGAPIHGRSH